MAKACGRNPWLVMVTSPDGEHRVISEHRLKSRAKTAAKRGRKRSGSAWNFRVRKARC